MPLWAGRFRCRSNSRTSLTRLLIGLRRCRRSEEHTSELQSPYDLVCRLLLEKKNWRLVKLLAALPSRNTDGLIGGVTKVLEAEGIHLRASTLLLKPLLSTAVALTHRKPGNPV